MKQSNQGEKSSFVLYTEYGELFKLLDGGNVKRLMSAIFAYVENETLPDFNDDKALNVAFTVIKIRLDRDTQKWLEIKHERAENGRKGGLTKAAKRN